MCSMLLPSNPHRPFVRHTAAVERSVVPTALVSIPGMHPSKVRHHLTLSRVQGGDGGAAAAGLLRKAAVYERHDRRVGGRGACDPAQGDHVRLEAVIVLRFCKLSDMKMQPRIDRKFLFDCKILEKADFRLFSNGADAGDDGAHRGARAQAAASRGGLAPAAALRRAQLPWGSPRTYSIVIQIWNRC